MSYDVFTIPLPNLHAAAARARDESCQPSRDVDDLHSPQLGRIVGGNICQTYMPPLTCDPIPDHE